MESLGKCWQSGWPTGLQEHSIPVDWVHWKRFALIALTSPNQHYLLLGSGFVQITCLAVSFIINAWYERYCANTCFVSKVHPSLQDDSTFAEMLLVLIMCMWNVLKTQTYIHIKYTLLWRNVFHKRCGYSAAHHSHAFSFHETSEGLV